MTHYPRKKAQAFSPSCLNKMQTNSVQLIAFLEMFYAGVLIGLCYDIIQYAFYAVFKRRLFSDILFWLITAIIALASMFKATQLDVRIYLICGILTGWGLYFLIVSPVFREIFNKIFLKASKTASKIKYRTKSKVNAFLIKNKRTIGKINIARKRLCAIPLSIKKIYNKYVKYFKEYSNGTSSKKTKKKNNSQTDV